MSTSYHMEALRRQRIIERAAAARSRIQSAILEASHVGTPVVSPSHSLANGVDSLNYPSSLPTKLSQQSNRTATASVRPNSAQSQSRQSNRTLSSEKIK